MSTYSIAVLVGSLRRGSYNQSLADAVMSLAPDDVSFEQLRIDDLPLYNQDDDRHPSAAAKRLKAQVAEADGVLFVTPEHNRSVTAALKNALDHASRPYGDSAWQGKPAGVIGASIGKPGSSMAQQHLRNMLAYLDMPTLGQPEVFVHVEDGMFDDRGRLTRDDTRTFLQGWMDAYVAWIKTHATAAAPARR